MVTIIPEESLAITRYLASIYRQKTNCPQGRIFNVLLSLHAADVGGTLNVVIGRNWTISRTSIGRLAGGTGVQVLYECAVGIAEDGSWTGQ